MVKAIHYKTDDEEFNKIEYDYRGNPKYSTMISKLCNFNIRSEYILKIIKFIISIKKGYQRVSFFLF